MIEDSFYKPRTGDYNPGPGSKQYNSNSNYNTKQYYKDDQQQFSSRMGSIDLPEEPSYQSLYKTSKTPKYERHVSVASSLGRVKGPQYPYKTKPSTQSKHRNNWFLLFQIFICWGPTRRPNVQRVTPSSSKSYNDNISSESSSTLKYFKNQNKFYDPFSFQSREKSSTNKFKQHQSNKNSIYANRLDSRFSIQVNKFFNFFVFSFQYWFNIIRFQESNYISSASAKSSSRSQNTKKPIVISYQEALRARTTPAPDQRLSTFSSLSSEPETVESRYFSTSVTPQALAGGYQGII